MLGPMTDSAALTACARRPAPSGADVQVAWEGPVSARTSAGLSYAAPWIPIAAAVGTLACLYLLPDFETIATRSVAVGLGLGFAVIVGALIAIVTAPRSSPSRANSRSYALVLQRICALRARLECLPPGEHACAEVKEAKDLVDQVEKRLGLVGDPDPIDPSWASGAAYQDLWTGIHRAEEALIACESPEDLRAGIIHDKLRVKGSPLSKSLEPELDRITTELNGPSPNLLEVSARLRQVRRAVNEYRDERWDGLVRARLRLVRSAVMTAWTAYGLLILALAMRASRDSITAGGAFFIVGALVGLVAQVRSDARRNEAVEDYGLASARLYQTVLASGLAGVAGVLLMPFVAQVASTASGAAAVQPTTSFNVALNPGQLILAAIFGLSPQIIFDRLTASADQYKAQLATTQAAQPAAATVDSAQAGAG
jgi:hypothetical protein